MPETMSIRIVACGRPEEQDIHVEKAFLQQGLPGVEVVFRVCETTDDVKAAAADADALLISFAVIDENVLNAAPHLRCIAVSATGYGNVDVAAATAHGVAVCPIGEYCTDEVADHTLALMLALLRNLKHYTRQIEQDAVWAFDSAVCRRLKNLTLSVFGFGRIGRAVAKRAQAFGIRVLAVDPYVPPEVFASTSVTPADIDTALRKADIITNHMNQTSGNDGFFNLGAFRKCTRKPLFLNIARGASVNEDDLCTALDEGLLSGAGLDVLRDENPDLRNCPLVGRDNVLLTPHAAFYSQESLADLRHIPCSNLIHFFHGDYDRIQNLVNPQTLA